MTQRRSFRCVLQEPDGDISTTTSWFIASAAFEPERDFVEVSFPYYWGPVFTDLERSAVDGEVIVLRYYLNAPLKKAVIERDTDDLTREELVTYRDAVVTAIATELKTYHNFKCFSRRPKQGARNVIDGRWVIKWKFVQQPD